MGASLQWIGFPFYRVGVSRCWQGFLSTRWSLRLQGLGGLLQGYIDHGRSTAGPAQQNDFDLSITGDSKGKRKKQDQKAEAAVKSPAKRAREMALAADVSFD